MLFLLLYFLHNIIITISSSGTLLMSNNLIFTLVPHSDLCYCFFPCSGKLSSQLAFSSMHSIISIKLGTVSFLRKLRSDVSLHLHPDSHKLLTSVTFLFCGSLALINSILYTVLWKCIWNLPLSYHLRISHTYMFHTIKQVFILDKDFYFYFFKWDFVHGIKGIKLAKPTWLYVEKVIVSITWNKILN